MSARLLSSRAVSAAVSRRTNLATRRVLSASPLSTSATKSNPTSGGLLRLESVLRSQRQSWPNQVHRAHSAGALTVRGLSFHRAIPKLMMKFIRIPAAFGGAMIAGLAYVQYQAQQAGNYAIGIVNQAGEIVGTTYSGARQKVDDIYGGVTEKLNAVEMPEWMQGLFSGGGGEGSGGSAGGGGEGPGGGKKTAAAAAATGGAAAAFVFGDDEKQDQQSAKDDQMMLLTRKMIEIRSILQKVGQTGVLQLPSIVVIGSQSSGKSSVLEAIVGHEFLPKGSNMVTRRPIELTLINTPNSPAEYGEFPALGLGRITDFAQIQRTLTDLNLAVPEADCVSDDPIQLHIYSPAVPDLSLIDLPGYIQITAHDQPSELKGKIAALCDKYIQAPNVILAISAADVDLANSTALRASRRVDPRGERTIGVITKMDLVDPARGSAILRDKNYPLRLGYVGVVCRTPASPKLGFLGGGKNANITNAIAKTENAFFGSHPEFSAADSPLTVGTQNLRKKLMTVLEQTMALSLQSTSDAIHQELEEAAYEFKVQYNDRPLTAETYLAESLDRFKHAFKDFTEHFGRPQVRQLLKHELDQKVLDLLASRYWNKPLDTSASRSGTTPRLDERPLSELPNADSESLFWHRRLDASTSSLTKLGVGRLATNVVANALTQHMDRLISESTFKEHPFAKQAIQEATNAILNERFYSTSDQVENCIKPYKFEIEVDDREWATSRESAQNLLKEELRSCEAALGNLKASIGAKKMGQVMAFVEKMRSGENVETREGTEAFGFSQPLLQKGREGVFLKERADLIKMRMAALKGKQCASKANKYHCPEIFMDVVAEKLTATAVLFLNVELLSEFYYNFPRELDNRLGRHLTTAQVEAFAREDPKVRKHIDLQKRKELLELALEKMESLMALEKSKKAAQEPRGAEGPSHVRGRWGF